MLVKHPAEDGEMLNMHENKEWVGPRKVSNRKDKKGKYIELHVRSIPSKPLSVHHFKSYTKEHVKGLFIFCNRISIMKKLENDAQEDHF